MWLYKLWFELIFNEKSSQCNKYCYGFSARAILARHHKDRDFFANVVRLKLEANGW